MLPSISFRHDFGVSATQNVWRGINECKGVCSPCLTGSLEVCGRLCPTDGTAVYPDQALGVAASMPALDWRAHVMRRAMVGALQCSVSLDLEMLSSLVVLPAHCIGLADMSCSDGNHVEPERKLSTALSRNTSVLPVRLLTA